MRVRCEQVTQWHGGTRATASPWLTVDAEYDVVALSASRGPTWLQVVADNDALMWFDARLFVTIDDTVPPEWVAHVDDLGQFDLSASTWQREGFWRALFEDGDTAARREVDDVAGRLAQRVPRPAHPADYSGVAPTRFDARVRHDATVNATYVHLAGTTGAGAAVDMYACDPARAGMTNLDFDVDGRLLGIEVVDARRAPHQVYGVIDGSAPVVVWYDDASDAAYLSFGDLAAPPRGASRYLCDPARTHAMITLEFTAASQLAGLEVRPARHRLSEALVAAL